MPENASEVECANPGCHKAPKGKSAYCSDSCRAKASHARLYGTKKERHADGRFKATVGFKIDSKGYPCITAGPLRGQRLHRVIAKAMLGRELLPDEDVHHKDKDKLNFDPFNLEVLGHKEHGSVSAKQHWYCKQHDIDLKEEWDAYFESPSPSPPKKTMRM